MARRVSVTVALTVVLLVVAAPAFACGGLVGPNGAVNLLKTTTFAGYVDGVEHYVTSFEFAGADAGEFGSLVPLPGIPSKVERGGEWTLQRLVRETEPITDRAVLAFGESAATSDRARVILQTRIDALDITVLEGGAAAVIAWAEENGFALSPDAPEVLDFYAKRSPVFMAAKFDAAAAAKRGQRAGDGTPIHLTIPTHNPWVPLRILALGKQPVEPVEADIYLLTELEPAMLPAPRPPAQPGVPGSATMTLARSEPASASLLADLRSDKGMEWLPASGMWLTYVQLNGLASEVTFDLAIDASGANAPSPVSAGLAGSFGSFARDVSPAWNNTLILALLTVVALALGVGRRIASE